MMRYSGRDTIDLPPDFNEYRYFMFPILSKSNRKNRGRDHWTLLVVDNLTGDVKFYNSMLPRRMSADPYIDDAKELVRFNALFWSVKKCGH